MLSQEIGTTWTTAGLVAASALGMLVGMIVFVRVGGLRSFSKMSSFDFAVTVAFGSVLGATALSKSSLIDGLVAIASLIVLQTTVAFARCRWRWARVVDNQPILLMDGSEMLDDHLRRAKVTRGDVVAKLREANVTSWDQVRAVVMETTGDISVLHRSDGGELDKGLLDDVLDPRAT